MRGGLFCTRWAEQGLELAPASARFGLIRRVGPKVEGQRGLPLQDALRDQQ